MEHQAEPLSQGHEVKSSSTLALTIAALGVVYGDIGTSPLYAMRECFHGAHAISLSPSHVTAVTSLIIWALILIVSVKYLCVVLRASNQGEGGILALTSLAKLGKRRRRETNMTITVLGLFGAALLYGDGAITPAISVLSALEGVKVLTHRLEPFIMPLTILILFGLFFFQRHGSAKIGLVFGPIIILWFLTLGTLGVKGILLHPQILSAFNPIYGVEFLSEPGSHGLAILGSVFLAVTGAEALYADMGHFGKRAIRLGWYSVALPGLVLNYLGQGALLLHSPEAASNPFYMLAPRWALIPLVVLATSATVIASQALISGVFSITSQAIQLGYLPRMQILHTSSSQYGQIYLPKVNWTLFLATVTLVLGFGSSSNLAAAYGIAVSLTMVITALLLFFVMTGLWHWPVKRSALLVGIFLVIDSAFLAANSMKLFQGGWFPLLLAAALFLIMKTWRQGRHALTLEMRGKTMGIEEFLNRIPPKTPLVPGSAVFLSRDPSGVPTALIHNLRHNKVLHEMIVILHIANLKVPYAAEADRMEIVKVNPGFYRLILRFGFMEKPTVLPGLTAAKEAGLPVNLNELTYFLGAETILPKDNDKGMALWREHLFAFMSHNAQRAANFYDIPAGQVVELGVQVEI